MRRFPLVGLLIPLIFFAGPARADDAGPTCGPPARAPGFEAHLDPATGRLVPPPPGSPPLAGSTGRRSAAAPSARLVENPNPAPAGGVGVRLYGHFDTSLTATMQADGKARTRCTTLGPGPVRP